MDDHAETDLAGDEREHSHLPRIGLTLTVLYLAGLVLYPFLQGQNPANLRLTNSAIRQGVSSPLA